MTNSQRDEQTVGQAGAVAKLYTVAEQEPQALSQEAAG